MENTTKSAKMWNKREKLNQYGFLITKKSGVSGHWPLHWHNCWELEVVVSGTGRQMLNGTPCEITSGTVYILNPTDYHEITCENLNVYNISFSDELLSDDFVTAFTGNGGGRQAHISGAEFEQLVAICDMLLYESERGKAMRYADLAAKSLLDLLFVRLLRLFCYTNDKPANGAKAAIVSRAVSYVNIHFRESPSLSDTARYVGITPNYLSEEFHRVTGKTYKEYLNDVRLMYAKKLLASSALSVTEICFASGFSSLSNFLRVFKAHFGVSPQNMQRLL